MSKITELTLQWQEHLATMSDGEEMELKRREALMTQEAA